MQIINICKKEEVTMQKLMMSSIIKVWSSLEVLDNTLEMKIKKSITAAIEVIILFFFEFILVNHFILLLS